MNNQFQQQMSLIRQNNERKRLAELQSKYQTAPDYTNMSLRDELNTRYEIGEMNQLQQKYPPENQTSYGNATAKKLNDYISNYQYPKGNVKTGLIAPVNDMLRNYNTMKTMQLKESDPFFHCKANYEAASQGIYGTIVANTIDLGKEIWDNVVKHRPIEDSFRDYRANLRGQKGAWNNQSLQETCPTHHKYYK